MKKTEARAILRATKTMNDVGIIASKGKQARSEAQKAATLANFAKMQKARNKSIKGNKGKRRKRSIFGL